MDPMGFQTVAAIAALVVVGEEFIDKLWNLDGVASQIRTLVIGAILGLVGAWLGLGMFTDTAVCGEQAWYVCGPVVGLLGGAAGNVAFLTPLIKALLEALKIRPKQE